MRFVEFTSSEYAGVKFWIDPDRVLCLSEQSEIVRLHLSTNLYEDVLWVRESLIDVKTTLGQNQE